MAIAASALSMLIGVHSAHASNWLFIRESPLQYFEAADLKQVRGTAMEMLDRGRDGQSTSWRNPETGNSGEVRIIAPAKGADAACRELLLKVRARNGLADQASLRICKGKSGWALSAP
jgi:hypothetical protein